MNAPHVTCPNCGISIKVGFGHELCERCKSLKIDEHSSDKEWEEITNEDYDCECLYCGEEKNSRGNPLVKFRFRKRKPKAPSHEEIMTKWWYNDISWIKVFDYDTEGDDNNRYGLLSAEPKYCEDSDAKYRSWVPKEWFIGRESADIPPEAE